MIDKTCITQEQMDAIMEEHQKWLEDPRTGKRADLSWFILGNKLSLQYNFTKAICKGTRFFSDNSMEGVKFDEADCTGAVFTYTDLKHASFKGTILDETIMEFVDLHYADFTGVKIKNIKKLYSCKGIETVKGISAINGSQIIDGISAQYVTLLGEGEEDEWLFFFYFENNGLNKEQVKEMWTVRDILPTFEPLLEKMRNKKAH